MKSNIAQLNILRKKFGLGARQLEAYFSEGGEQKENLVRLLLQAHIQAKNDQGAVPWATLMLEKDILKSRKDYDAALYLFDSPIHRTSQIQVANKMLKRWPRDASLQFQIAVLKGKAQREGIDPIVLAGKAEAVEKARNADLSDVSYQEAKPIFRVPGPMPPGAGKSGHCTLIFDVIETGSVSNIRTKSCSDAVFEAASVKAIRKWVYSPKIVNGEPVITPNVEQTMRYIMHNSKGEKLPE